MHITIRFVLLAGLGLSDNFPDFHGIKRGNLSKKGGYLNIKPIFLILMKGDRVITFIKIIIIDSKWGWSSHHTLDEGS